MRIYSTNTTKIPFEKKLQDRKNPYNVKEISLDGSTRLYFWVRFPDGLEKTYDAVRKDSTNIIRYVTTEKFPDIGDYIWTVGAEYDGKEFRDTDIEIFWVF